MKKEIKSKKLTPRNSAPVQRENVATVSRDGNATVMIAPAFEGVPKEMQMYGPFAGEDAE